VEKKQLAVRTNFVLFIVVVIGFVAVFNYLMSKFFLRVDITANKIFTISDASKKIMRDLDDLVMVKVFISEKNLPPLAMNLTRTIKDLLTEYEAYSRGNLTVTYYDPTENEDLKTEARSLGVQEVPMQIIEKDKQQNVMCFMGLAILYGDKKEIVPVLNNVGNLEYDLSSRILKVTRTEVKKVGFYFGNGPHMFMPEQFQNKQGGPRQTYNNLKKVLQEQFEVQVVSDLAKGKKVPDDVPTLVVAGPKSLDGREKFEIDQFVMRGGRLIALVDAVEVQTSYGLNATKQAHNTGDLFTHYGARVNQNLIADASHSHITYQVNYGGFVLPISTPYPLWIKAIKPGLHDDNPAVSGLASLMFMWASSIETVLDSADTAKQVTVKPLISTTQFAKEMSGYFDLNPRKQWDFRTGDRKAYDLAVVMEGEFKSFYHGKPVPQIKDEADTTGQAKKPAEGDDARVVPEKSAKTTIVLFGDSDFLVDGTPRENTIFMINLVEWLTLGDNLISIRSKSITERVIDPKLSAGTKSFVRIFNTVIMPLLVILLGVVVFFRRRNLIRKGA
jgi:gliding-associated putative ABC transporter substrate-binding component GldG